MPRFTTRTSLIVIVLIGTTVGALMWWRLRAPRPLVDTRALTTAEMWSCAQHPEVRRFEPGLCPVCGRPLELVEAPAGSGPP